MKSWKKAFRHNSAKWEEISAWSEKEKSVTFCVYGLVRNLEQIELVPYVLALVPLALFHWINDSGFIALFMAPSRRDPTFLLLGFTLVICAMFGKMIQKLMMEPLQRKWIEEFYRDLAADPETVEAFEKLKKLDSAYVRRLEKIKAKLGG
jgi:hypothetical protein